MENDPFFDEIRSDPRYILIEKRVVGAPLISFATSVCAARAPQ